MKVLICGGRTYGVATDESRNATQRANREIAHVQTMLDALHARYKFTKVIHGGAKGADTLAKIWANRRHFPGRLVEWAQRWTDPQPANAR